MLWTFQNRMYYIWYKWHSRVPVKTEKKEKPLIWVKTTNKISSQKSKVTTSPRSLDNIQKARPSQAELLKIDKEGIITLLCLKIDKHGKATLLKWNCIETTAAGVCTGL